MGRRSFTRHVLPVLMCALFLIEGGYSVGAETLQEIQQEKKDAQDKKKEAEKKLDSVNRDIDNISSEQEALEAEIEELDAELVDLLLSVSLLESDIKDKEHQIETTKQELEQAKNRVSEQEATMARRIKFMYERGSSTYLELFLESKSMAEAVNKTEYSEKLYKYDRLMLERYRLAKQDVEDKEIQLEDELSELEEIKDDLNTQKEELDALIAEKRESVEDFESQLSKARAKAGEFKNQISQQTDNLKKLNQAEAEKIAEEERKKAEEEAKRKAEEAAKKKTEEGTSSGKSVSDTGNLTIVNELSSTGDSSSSTESTTGTTGEAKTESTGSTTSEKTSGTSVTATGSGLGTDIANYALQFVGNPYVAGGTSLTNGCDCSGFTQSVYSNFGISIPRSSYAQSSGGQEVTYDAIQAGDIIYYGGHVAIYIGNDQIVHASTASTGIKISSAFYRSIVTIRRYY